MANENDYPNRMTSLINTLFNTGAQVGLDQELPDELKKQIATSLLVY